MTDPTIDVLIIGAGPAGTTLAIDLARRGRTVRVIDKADDAFHGSRAKGVQPRTLEVFDDLGVLDDVREQGSLYPKLGIHLGPLMIPKAMYPIRRPTGDIPYPNTWLIPQNRTDRALHARLARLGGTVEFGSELIDFNQDAEKVTAKIATATGVETITASYLVGADGASSAVRKQLGIEFTGTTDEGERMVIVDAATTGLSRDRWHVWPALGNRFVGACPLPHGQVFQWMIRLTPDEEPPLDEASINARIQSHIHNKRITLRDITWVSVWRPNIRLAERYRHGRVLIAGDAAHVHTPAGAQGLNTGVGDSYNLGWKLGQVLAGADTALLDSYEAERQPIAAAVLGLSTKKYEGIAKLDPSSITRGEDESQLGLTYYGGPLAPSSAERTTTLQVGDRAPDAELLAADGSHVRLFGEFRGPHFTAIAFGPHAVADLGRLDWPTAGSGLKRITINAESGADAVLLDCAQKFRNAYGIAADALLLIRPDGYIGHIALGDMLATTQSAARAMTPPASSDTAPQRHLASLEAEE
jgi:2-polyprenyl-6-methoxyphenol hydroxylase-like FAD-dependent oxidoreductase